MNCQPSKMFRQIINLRGVLVCKVQHNVSVNQDQVKKIRKCFALGLVNDYSSLNQLNVHDILAPLGLSECESSTMLVNHPEISSCSNDQLQFTVDSLMKCQFGRKELVALILKHPYLLCVPHSDIEYMFQNLNSVGSKSSAYKILLHAPNILNECWSEVERKIDYLENVMLFTRGEIAVSGSLNYSLSFIMMRHSFLLKVGVFKKLSPKMKPHERQKVNPGLNVILNTSDSDFATKFAGVTLPEYEMYQQMFDPDECI